MNVWMKKCRKQATCKYCPNPIVKGEYMVVCKYYRRTRRESGGEAQKWKFFMRFHPQCWIDQAIAALEKRGIVETRGRKKLEMSDEVRGARLKIMMRRASIVQRIRRELTKPAEEQDMDRVIHLGGMLNKLKEEIEPLGGEPKAWS